MIPDFGKWAWLEINQANGPSGAYAGVLLNRVRPRTYTLRLLRSLCGRLRQPSGDEVSRVNEVPFRALAASRTLRTCVGSRPLVTASAPNKITTDKICPSIKQGARSERRGGGRLEEMVLSPWLKGGTVK